MARTVLNAADRIQEKYGGKWERVGAGILKPPPSISTGSILLNEAIGECKGYPEGCIVEAFGPQHSGKTLMGYLAIAQSQKTHPGRDNLLIDAENQFRFQASWAQQVGVDVAKLFLSPATSAEEAFEKIEMAILGDVELDKNGFVSKVIKPGNFGIIMIDSVTQLVPLEMVHKAMDENKRMGLLASVMSVGLKKVVSAMSLTHSKTILFFINQTRANPGARPGTNPEVRTGGNALPFYDTIAFRVSKVRKSEERDEKGKIFAHQCKVRFEKNKAGQLPADPIIFRLRYDGTGIDNDFEMWSVAEMNGMLVKFKRKYNFCTPGTDTLIDPSIEPFTQDEFGKVVSTHPNIKKIIADYISKGSFYAKTEIPEEDPDSSEEKLSQQTNSSEETPIEVVESPEPMPETSTEVQPEPVPTETVAEPEGKKIRRKKKE